MNNTVPIAPDIIGTVLEPVAELMVLVVVVVDCVLVNVAVGPEVSSVVVVDESVLEVFVTISIYSFIHIIIINYIALT